LALEHIKEGGGFRTFLLELMEANRASQKLPNGGNNIPWAAQLSLEGKLACLGNHAAMY